MPSYQYQCESCSHTFAKILKVDDRDEPTKLACPNCNEHAITRPVVASSFIYNPSGQIRITDSFNDRLIEIKKTKGAQNTINTRRSAI